MSVITIILISLGLAMDAFAVSVTNGMCYKKLSKLDMFLTVFTFGAFQAVMPLLGFLFGNVFLETIVFLDHWIALFFLGAIGVNMIQEGVKSAQNVEDDCISMDFTYKLLIMQGIATSIDALAVGISFAVTKSNIIFAASSIGIITFLCCSFGIFLGKRFDSLLKDKAELFGGSILIFIGIKTFIEHTFFNGLP